MPLRIAKIAVPAPLLRFFDYEIPEALRDRIAPGMRVQIPFGRQAKIGIVVELLEHSEFKSLKPISTVLDETPLLDPVLMKLILWGARHYLSPPGEAFRAVLPSPFWKQTKRRNRIKPPRPPAEYHPKQITYTEAQETAISTIWSSIADGKIFLLHGVTGSGKTEVYLELARRILKDKSVLFLVPEIALTPQLLGRCSAELPEKVGIYHSALTDRQRQEIWEECRAGTLRVVVGTRSALFLPMQNLGLIIVDEEHDGSFKQEERFRYNARDLAIVRGRDEGAPVILGSATPSLESLQRCRDDKSIYLTLPERAGGSTMPEIRFVDLGQRESRNSEEPPSLISEELTRELDNVLQRGEQSILFLNRRGFSPVQLCQDCGQTLQCPHCHITLTLHRSKGHLLCHYCLHEQRESPSCTGCGSTRVIWVGWGTERIEEDLQSRFPRARIARLDRDSTRKKGSLEETLEKMRRGEIDILVGTQILAKGHDYANVTLVGVLLSESSLNLPDFRAGERTFQLITQVAGRAGRGELPGRVLVQGFQANHYVMRAALDHDFAGFADRELANRKDLQYPPFRRLVQIVFRGKRQGQVVDAANQAVALIRKSVGAYSEVLGPAPCPIEKLRGEFRWQLVLKTKNFSKVREKLHAHLDVDFPNSLPSGVTVVVDVDPLNML